YDAGRSPLGLHRRIPCPNPYDILRTRTRLRCNDPGLAPLAIVICICRVVTNRVLLANFATNLGHCFAALFDVYGKMRKTTRDLGQLRQLISRRASLREYAAGRIYPYCINHEITLADSI